MIFAGDDTCISTIFVQNGKSLHTVRSAEVRISDECQSVSKHTYPMSAYIVMSIESAFFVFDDKV